MNWDQRKVFVASSIDKMTKQRRRTEADKFKTWTKLCVPSGTRRVVQADLQRDFSATLSLGEWSV
jgi:hypothetical protein